MPFQSTQLQPRWISRGRTPNRQLAVHYVGHLLDHCRALRCGSMPDCRRSISANLRKTSLKSGHITDMESESLSFRRHYTLISLNNTTKFTLVSSDYLSGDGSGRTSKCWRRVPRAIKTPPCINNTISLYTPHNPDNCDNSGYAGNCDNPVSLVRLLSYRGYWGFRRMRNWRHTLDECSGPCCRLFELRRTYSSYEAMS